MMSQVHLILIRQATVVRRADFGTESADAGTTGTMAVARVASAAATDTAAVTAPAAAIAAAAVMRVAGAPDVGRAVK